METESHFSITAEVNKSTSLDIAFSCNETFGCGSGIRDSDTYFIISTELQVFLRMAYQHPMLYTHTCVVTTYLSPDSKILSLRGI